MKKTLVSLLCIAFALAAQAQGAYGSLRGTITDEFSKQPIYMAVVKLQSGTQTLGAFTDSLGNYIISGIPTGKYTIELSALGYLSLGISELIISDGSMTLLNRNLDLKEGNEVVIVWEQWKDDLLGAGQPGIMKRIDAEEIEQNASLRGVGDIIANSVPRVYMKDDGEALNFSGSRTGSTLYMIDGVKVIGDPQIPNRGIGEVVVITGGIPAQFGDTTSGVVMISTKSYR